MAVLGEVFGSLGFMSQLQLLLAFMTCGGYAFAQGRLLPPKGRRIAVAVTVVCAVGFAIESPDWTLGAMLLGFAVAGLGTFAAVVWATSRLLGFGREPSPAAIADAPLDSSFAPAAEPRLRGSASTGPAHFV
ncbi:MAG: hypothetical protein M3O01_07790 [Pseudomonadota bacterium]|nr:hypothetical protein [Pseudomonadota bacterium]